MSKLAPKYDVDVVAAERYGRTDSSVVAQVLKVLMKKPDAVLTTSFGLSPWLSLFASLALSGLAVCPLH